MVSLEGRNPTATEPLVSVIIPAYRAAGQIGGQLECLARQVDAPPFEVIISDNGGNGELAGVLSAFTDRLNLTVVDSSRVQNVSHARNVGASQASTDYLLICDADDFVCQGWVATMYDLLTGYPNAYILGQYHPVEDTGDLSFEHPQVQDIFYTPKWQTSIVQEADDGQPIRTHFFIGGASLGIRKSRLADLGGFDSSYQRGGDDWDIFARARLAGMQQVSSYAAAIAYRVTANPRRQLRRQRFYGLNDVLIQCRYRGLVPPIKPARQCWWDLLKTPYRLVRYRDRASRLKTLSETGYALGYLQGLTRFRLLGQVPRPFFPPPAGTSLAGS